MTRVGLILPSSNRVVEDVLCKRPGDVQWHVTRLRVQRVALDADAAAQFELERMTEAAGLLADAEVDALAWAGSAGAWTGIERERALAVRLAEASGRPVTTTILAVLDALRVAEVDRIALLTPFTDEVQALIRKELTHQDITVVADRALGLESSLAMSRIDHRRIMDVGLDVGRSDADAIVILCTNLRGWEVARALESATGRPVVDSVLATLDAVTALARRPA